MEHLIWTCGVKPSVGHALAQAALLQKIRFQAAELVVDEVVGLVDETDRNVGDHCGRTGFHKCAIVFEFLRGFPAKFSDVTRLLGILAPLGQIARP